MALPRIDTPVYELTLPLSKKNVRFRPFLVKEQKNLLMAIEADDKDTIERNIKQILINCTLTEGLDIDNLPVVDVEYYFINLRAKSVGEIIENKYICNNKVESEEGLKECGNTMTSKFDLTEIKVDMDPNVSDTIELTKKISIKLCYPKFSTVERISKSSGSVDAAFDVVIDSIEYIYDGEQYYYANESTREELVEFIDQLNTEQFGKIETFFEKLPKITKHLELKCKKCGFKHDINVEGLESFFA